MTKEQVAFKFHECPDGEEADSRGNFWTHKTRHTLINRIYREMKFCLIVQLLINFAYIQMYVFIYRSDDWYHDGE